MNLFIEGKQIKSICIKTGQNTTEYTAAGYLTEYAAKLGFAVSDNADLAVSIERDGSPDDGFSISLTRDRLDIRGGKRGVIYAVFSFLETLGCRFFTHTIEKLPDGDVHVGEFSRSECSPFEFRDVLSNGATERVWSLKQKLNSNLWNTRKFTALDGGGYMYAGIPAHSLTGEFLLKPYVESHPEYFSLVDGVRKTDCKGQICMTNEEAIKAAAEEACLLLRKNPDKNIVSVSQGDNDNFCQCDACRKATEEQGLMRLYFGVVNKIAAIIKKEFPKAIVHTFAYAKLCESIDFKLEDNIMVQYCYGKCATHAIDDEDCKWNRKTAAQLKKVCGACNNVHVWNYTNCFKHELFEYPFIHNFRRNFRFFAETGVRGIFNEGMHRSAEDTDFAVTMELRSYLLARLMWNPYMTEEQFRTDMSEFCHAFYGDGGDHIVEYLDLYKEMSGECGSYDMFVPDTENKVKSCTIKKDMIPQFAARAYELLDKADAMTQDRDQKYRIDKLRTTVIYFDLYYTMDDILEHGTEEEKKDVLARNSALIDRIFAQNLVLTFWGQFRRDQNIELNRMRDVSPVHWNYNW